MDTRQLVVTIVGLVATAGTLIKAGVRLRDFWQDHQFAKLIVGPGQDERLEILMTKNLYRAQIVRFLTYLSILILFIVPLLVGPGEIILLRTFLIPFVLVSFAAEEFYLDRARDRWLSSIRKDRNAQAVITKQGIFLDTAVVNQAAMQDQQDLATSALEEQTALTDAARMNRKTLEEQQKRERKNSS